MIKPSLIVPRLRNQVASVSNRVFGGAQYVQAMKTANFGGIARPCLFVSPGGVEPGENQDAFGVVQRVRPRFGVVLVVDATVDELGADGAEKLVDLHDAVKAALLGWAPAGDRYDSFLYLGMPDDPVADSSRAMLFAQVDFETAEIIQS
jgi:hypothetical protein